MDLKEKIVSSYVAFEDGVNINSDIHEIRTEAFQNFEKLGFPSKKLEAWKYTSLNTILKEDYSIFQNKEKTINLADVKQYFISSEPGEEMKKIMEERGIPRNRLRPLVFLENFENDTNSIKDKDPLENSKLLNNYLKENEVSDKEVPKFFYEII